MVAVRILWDRPMRPMGYGANKMLSKDQRSHSASVKRNFKRPEVLHEYVTFSFLNFNVTILLKVLS